MRTPFAPDPRGPWVAVLERAQTVAAASAAGVALDADARRELAHLSARAGAVRFPLPHASATDAAAGFAKLLRGFLACARPEAAQALAQAVLAAARCCRALIELEDQAAQAAFQAAEARRLGERD